MLRFKSLLSLFLVVMLVTPVVAQDTHVADEAALQALIQKKLDEDAADRAAVGKLLERPEVRVVAGKLGLTTGHIEAASAALDGDELRLLASTARAFDEDMVGGQWSGKVTWFAIIAVIAVVVILFAVAG